MMDKTETSGRQRVAPRTRRARIVFWAIMVLSVAAAVLLAISINDGTRRTDVSLLTSGSLPATTAAIVIAVFAVAMIASLVWLWIADEHEAAAYNFGGVSAIHAYFTLLPIWLLGWWGGFLSEPDHLVVFAATAIVWCAGWGWRRYR